MSVRDRIEAAQMAERYAARQGKLTQEQVEEQAEEERRERLAKNAAKIRQDQISNLLIDMSDDERMVVFSTIGKDKPDCLGNSDVIAMEVEKVRVEGRANFHRIMKDTTKAEKEKVWEILATGDAFARTGMDPEACEKALKQVRHEQFMNEEEN
jgi:hypothetical protein